MNNLLAEFNAATDENNHTGATIILNNAILELHPTSSVYRAYVVILENIKATHELAGSLNSCEVAVRDAIQSTLIGDCKLFGLLPK